MANQAFVLPTDVSSVHVAPESVDVQMCPLVTVAASLVPSLEDVMLRKFPPVLRSIQVVCASTGTLSDNRATSRTLSTLR